MPTETSPDSTTVHGYCALCTAHCATIATVENGRVTRLDADLTDGFIQLPALAHHHLNLPKRTKGSPIRRQVKRQRYSARNKFLFISVSSTRLNGDL
jgi:hypothetical protein